jgi:hypothetical protein
VEKTKDSSGMAMESVKKSIQIDYAFRMKPISGRHNGKSTSIFINPILGS